MFQIVMKLLIITLQLLVCSKLSNNLIMPYQSEVFWVHRRQVFRSDKLSPAEHSWCCIHIRRNYRVILLIERPGTGVRTRIREQNRRFLRPYPQTSYHRQCPTHRGSRPPDVLYQTLRFQPTSLAQQNIVSFSALYSKHFRHSFEYMYSDYFLQIRILGVWSNYTLTLAFCALQAER